jgi:hypothetical protein
LERLVSAFSLSHSKPPKTVVLTPNSIGYNL